MGQYLPVVALAGPGRRVRGAQPGDVAGCSRPAPPTAAKRRPTSAASCPSREPPRALPGALLPGRDDLHRLRHRDHLPLPLGGHLPEPRRLRAGRDAASSPSPCSSRSSTCSATAPSTGARSSSSRRLSPMVVRRPHHRRPRSGGSASTAATSRDRGGGGLMGWDMSARASRASTTTSSPASSRTSSSGPAASQRDAGHLRPGLLRHRDDGRRRRRTTTSPASAWRSSGPRPARPTS